MVTCGSSICTHFGQNRARILFLHVVFGVVISDEPAGCVERRVYVVRIRRLRSYLDVWSYRCVGVDRVRGEARTTR